MGQNLEVRRHTPPEDYKATEKITVKRIAIYCRVSTLAEEQEESYIVQRSYYERMVAADPTLVLVDVYGDQGISGKSAKKRPEFQRMLLDCMSGKVDIVICKSISRFARNLADCIENVRVLLQKGISVIFEREGINTADARSELLLSILASIAQEEINSTSQNVLWAHEKRNASGDPIRRVSYGYRKVKQPDGRSTWEINEHEARRIRFIFEQAAARAVYISIIHGLEALESEEGSHVRWRPERVREIILNEVYIGDLLTNKTYTPDYLAGKTQKNKGQRHQYYIEGHHEPIITRRLWELAKSNLKAGYLRSGRIKNGSELN